MILNVTHNYQFTTRVNMHGVNLEVGNTTKLLGTHITNDLKWDLNTKQIVRKGNARTQLLLKISSFGGSIEDMKHIYIVLKRSIIETSISVWHISLTKENENYLERIQKTAFRLILGNSYISYENTQSLLCFSTLKDKR